MQHRGSSQYLSNSKGRYVDLGVCKGCDEEINVSQQGMKVNGNAAKNILTPCDGVHLSNNPSCEPPVWRLGHRNTAGKSGYT